MPDVAELQKRLFRPVPLQAVEEGLLAESDLDRAVTPILTLKFELGLFENPRAEDPVYSCGSASFSAAETIHTPVAAEPT